MNLRIWALLFLLNLQAYAQAPARTNAAFQEATAGLIGVSMGGAIAAGVAAQGNGSAGASLWKIERDKESFGRATALSGATIQGLADTIGLDAREAKAWLTSANGRWQVQKLDGTYEWTDDVGANPRSPIRGEERFAIPNTIIMAWAGDFDGIGRDPASRWHDSWNCLQNDLGFRVEEILVKDEKEGDVMKPLRDKIQQLSQVKALHGYYYTGHGSPTGMCVHSGWHCLGYDEMEHLLAYHLGFVIINACNGGWSRADLNGNNDIEFYSGSKDGGKKELGHHDYGGRIIENAVKSKTQLNAGGMDLAARVSPGNRAWGIKDIFLPDIFPLMRGDTMHPWDLLKPGEQGTRH